MDFEKKYKEALERARKDLQACGTTECEAYKQIIRYFPELAESEDERMIKAITHILYENYTDAAVIKGVEIAEIITWLEEQKSKVVEFDHLKEQKPAEWSEEDEKMRTLCGASLAYRYNDCGITKGEYDEAIWWLKSLRPQPHWRPSEEQMEALKEASASWMNQEMGNSELLESLYKDLKNL